MACRLFVAKPLSELVHIANWPLALSTFHSKFQSKWAYFHSGKIFKDLLPDWYITTHGPRNGNVGISMKFSSVRYASIFQGCHHIFIPCSELILASDLGDMQLCLRPHNQVNAIWATHTNISTVEIALPDYSVMSRRVRQHVGFLVEHRGLSLLGRPTRRCTSPNRHMTQQWRNDNVFITSKRRQRRRLDVMKTLLLRCVPDGLVFITYATDPTTWWMQNVRTLQWRHVSVNASQIKQSSSTSC